MTEAERNRLADIVAGRMKYMTALEMMLRAGWPEQTIAEHAGAVVMSDLCGYYGRVMP